MTPLRAYSALLPMAQGLAAKDSAGSSGCRTKLWRDQERDAHMLQQQLVRERMENQRHAQAARTKDEELLRSEHAVRSLREQKVQLERQMSQLRGDLARSEAARQREVSDLKARLSTCEANHEREMLALEREAALRAASAAEAARREESKAQEALLSELGAAKSQSQRDRRESEAEQRRLQLDFQARLEEERRSSRRLAAARNSALNESLSGETEPSFPIASQGAAAAVSKMRLLEEQLKVLQQQSSFEGLSVTEPSSYEAGPAATARNTKEESEALVRKREAELLAELQEERAAAIAARCQASRALRNARSMSLPGSLLLDASYASVPAALTPPRAQAKELQAGAAGRQRPAGKLEGTLRLPSRKAAGSPAVEGSPVAVSSVGAAAGSSRPSGLSEGAFDLAERSSPREAAGQASLRHVPDTGEEDHAGSPSSCQVLSPALSLEAMQGESTASPALPGNAAGSIQATTVEVPPESPRRSVTSSPAPQAAGRLPPALLLGDDKLAEALRGERGGIGSIAEFSPQGNACNIARPEVDVEVCADHVGSASAASSAAEAREAEVEARLREAQSSSENWRQRSLILEERLQQILRDRAESESALLASATHRTASSQKEESSGRRWRPPALELEDEQEEARAREAEAWKRQRHMLEARLQQATEERDRMIEATNELRADMRRLERQVDRVPEAKPDKVPSAASAPSVPSPMSAASVMRQALAFVGGLNSDSSGGGAIVDRFGALSSPPRSPHSSRSPVLPLPGPTPPPPTVTPPAPAAGPLEPKPMPPRLPIARMGTASPQPGPGPSALAPVPPAPRRPARGELEVPSPKPARPDSRGDSSAEAASWMLMADGASNSKVLAAAMVGRPTDISQPPSASSTYLEALYACSHTGLVPSESLRGQPSGLDFVPPPPVPPRTPSPSPESPGSPSARRVADALGALSPRRTTTGSPARTLHALA